jgi:hypothetical protein
MFLSAYSTYNYKRVSNYSYKVQTIVKALYGTVVRPGAPTQLEICDQIPAIARTIESLQSQLLHSDMNTCRDTTSIGFPVSS